MLAFIDTIFRFKSQLVRELKQAEEVISAAAIARGEVKGKKKSSKSSKKSSSSKSSKKSSSSGKPTKQNHDDKNIRRRVYDALNVLMAMDIITKNKKEITWVGLPGSSAGSSWRWFWWDKTPVEWLEPSPAHSTVARGIHRTTTIHPNEARVPPGANGAECMLSELAWKEPRTGIRGVETATHHPGRFRKEKIQRLQSGRREE
jgi:hypothetical protein